MDNSTSTCNHTDTILEISIKITLLSSFTLFGSLANIFVIILALKYTVRSNLDHLIINMAVADAFYLLLRLWLFLGFVVFPLGYSYLVPFQELFRYVLFTVSLLSLLVISVERFNATRQTFQRTIPYTVKQRLAVVGVCWFISMIVNVYIFYYFEKVYYPTIGINSLVEELSYVYYGGVAIVIVILLLSFLTIKGLSKLGSIQSHFTQEQREKRASQSRSAVRMVFASLLLYVLCWIPYCIERLSIDENTMHCTTHSKSLLFT